MLAKFTTKGCQTEQDGRLAVPYLGHLSAGTSGIDWTEAQDRAHQRAQRGQHGGGSNVLAEAAVTIREGAGESLAWGLKSGGSCGIEFGVQLADRIALLERLVTTGRQIAEHTEVVLWRRHVSQVVQEPDAGENSLARQYTHYMDQCSEYRDKRKPASQSISEPYVDEISRSSPPMPIQSGAYRWIGTDSNIVWCNQPDVQDDASWQVWQRRMLAANHSYNYPRRQLQRDCEHTLNTRLHTLSAPLERGRTLYF